MRIEKVFYLCGGHRSLIFVVDTEYDITQAMANYQLKTLLSIAELPALEWNQLAGENPFLQFAFLAALERTACAVPETGWHSQYLLCFENSKLVGAMPLYFKTHSYGEFVFDWAWADAYQRSGLPYYPKLISAIPFTPVAGKRILADSPEVRLALLKGALQIAKQTKVSSLHILFPTAAEAREMEEAGFLLRQGVQFHWRNKEYQSFDDFLAGLRHDKRKKIKQERRKVREAGISFRKLSGNEISELDWDFFYQCYENTHRQYQSPQPMNRDFFRAMASEMANSILLIIGERAGKPICAALNFIDGNAIYGRSWGALEQHDSLHFETCYYQAIDFCIEKKLQLFEGGAQGEHKLARGFLPETTWSAHWLAQPEFFHAVENYLSAEKGKMALYVNELMDSNPFRK